MIANRSNRNSIFVSHRKWLYNPFSSGISLNPNLRYNWSAARRLLFEYRMSLLAPIDFALCIASLHKDSPIPWPRNFSTITILVNSKVSRSCFLRSTLPAGSWLQIISRDPTTWSNEPGPSIRPNLWIQALTENVSETNCCTGFQRKPGIRDDNRRYQYPSSSYSK